MEFATGSQVEIMEQGTWVGPFTVTAGKGRTADHIVLSGPSGTFEHFNDAPFNVRPVEASTERIETLACFSDHALSMMCNEGYRDDNDVLWTATAEEVAAVEAHREAKYQEWLISNPVAELESYVESDVISEVVVRVFGGNSHPARAEVAHDYLEDFTAYQSNPVVIDSYETAAKTTESGAAYVQFRFFAA